MGTHLTHFEITNYLSLYGMQHECFRLLSHSLDLVSSSSDIVTWSLNTGFPLSRSTAMAELEVVTVYFEIKRREASMPYSDTQIDDE